MRALILSISVLAALAATGSSIAGTPPSRELLVFNDSGAALRDFHIAPLDRESEAPPLGAVIKPGDTYVVHLDPEQCRYWWSAAFADGRKTGRRDYDACANPELHLGAMLGEDALAAKAQPQVETPSPPPAPRGTRYEVEVTAEEASEMAAEPVVPPPPPPPAPPPPPSPSTGIAPERGVPICPGDARCRKKPGG